MFYKFIKYNNAAKIANFIIMQSRISLFGIF